MTETVRYYNDKGEEVPKEEATQFEVTDDEGNSTVGTLVHE